MDCSSEEALIRMKLQAFAEVKSLEFDLPKRILWVYHQEGLAEVEKAIQDLNLGGELVGSEAVESAPGENEAKQRKLLWVVLVINFVFFGLEMGFGWLSQSMGLVADSLDMLADAVVYGLALFAVGAAVGRKKKVAQLAGIFQVLLAVIGIVEVVRRFVGAETMPEFGTMIVVSGLALVANGACLVLLQSSRSKEAHIQASMIFTSNDVIINLGVILAGALVHWTDSRLPDLAVGSIVFVIVLLGARRILSLAK